MHLFPSGCQGFSSRPDWPRDPGGFFSLPLGIEQGSLEGMAWVQVGGKLPKFSLVLQGHPFVPCFLAAAHSEGVPFGPTIFPWVTEASDEPFWLHPPLIRIVFLKCEGCMFTYWVANIQVGSGDLPHLQLLSRGPRSVSTKKITAGGVASIAVYPAAVYPLPESCLPQALPLRSPGISPTELATLKDRHPKSTLILHASHLHPVHQESLLCVSNRFVTNRSIWH